MAVAVFLLWVRLVIQALEIPSVAAAYTPYRKKATKTNMPEVVIPNKK